MFVENVFYARRLLCILMTEMHIGDMKHLFGRVDINYFNTKKVLRSER